MKILPHQQTTNTPDNNNSLTNHFKDATYAIRENKNNLLITLINSFGINTTDPENGMTALHISAFENCFDSVKILIENGADVNALDKNGLTPLAHALLYDTPAIILALIDAGADINTRSKLGLTALHIAAMTGNVTLLEYLIEKKADVDMQDEEGFTPLIYAAQHNYTTILEKLMKAGADVYIESNNKGNAFALAKINGHLDAIELLKGT